MPSESPYDLLGQRVLHPLTAVFEISSGDTAFGLAHQAYGEWRRWRQILDLNELTDAFDVRDLTVDSVDSQSEAYDAFGLVDALDAEYAHIGIADTLQFRLRITDDFFLQISSDDGETWGDTFAVDSDRLRTSEDPDGEFLTIAGTTDDFSVLFRVTKDAWLVLWIIREADLTVNMAPSLSQIVA